MKTYTYSLFAKIWYRYINIIVTILLMFYTAGSLYMAFQKWYYFFIVLLNVLIIYMVNKFYLSSYRFFPFKIMSDQTGITCSNFFLSKKNVRINFSEIDSISGGMFAGWNTRPVYIKNSKQKITIGFFMHGEFKELLKIILANINEDLYKDLLNKMKELSSLK